MDIATAPTDRLFDHLEDLHIYALHLTRDPDLAEDLVQDTVCQMLSRDVSLADVGNPRAYLAAILRNLWIDRARRAAPRHLPLDVHDPPDPGADAFHDLACAELWAAIDKLPAAYAQVLRLRVAGGLSYPELADALGIPIGTVMSRIARAREHLRALL